MIYPGHDTKWMFASFRDEEMQVMQGLHRSEGSTLLNYISQSIFHTNGLCGKTRVILFAHAGEWRLHWRSAGSPMRFEIEDLRSRPGLMSSDWHFPCSVLWLKLCQVSYHKGRISSNRSCTSQVALKSSWWRWTGNIVHQTMKVLVAPTRRPS